MKLKIKPPNDRKGLDFDLDELLDILGPRVATSAWSISGIQYVSQDDIAIPTLNGPDDSRVTGVELIAAIPNLLQVIDGEFKAFDQMTDDVPWVVLRAVDSSWWEVETDIPNIAGTIQKRFENVSELK